MIVRTPTELGAAIKDRRRKLRLEQRTLAEKAGVSRQWLIEVEKGKARAEIGLILRTLAALGIVVRVGEEPQPTSKRSAAAVDLDELIARARRPRK
jgi:HTH-type transcriptional regulator / antitoxin HipB